MSLFHRSSPVTKDMTVAQLLSLTPLTRDILKRHGIVFIGKNLSPLESLEVVGKGNGLSDTRIADIVREITLVLSQKPNRTGPLLILTPAAYQELERILSEKGKKAFRLRLASDGCGLYTYDLDFASGKQKGETAFSQGRIRIFLPTKHVPLLQGTELDFQSGFIFKNPNLRKE